MFYFKYALKSLVQRRKQYISLFAVCSVSVCIILAVTAVSDGMLKALNTKAVQYYGGELQLANGNIYAIDNPDEKVQLIKETLSEMGIESEVYKRFDYDGANTQFYFEGATTLSRILKGINIEDEKNLLDVFTFTERAEFSDAEDYILFSQPIAKLLGIHAGDSVTVLTNTIYGYSNTLNLTVLGIFQDSSLFGMYTAYLDINSLTKLAGYPEDYVNRLGIYTHNNSITNKQLEVLQEKLSGKIPMAPIPENKDKFFSEAPRMYEGNIYGLITLDANRPEVVMMTKALKLIVYLIIIPLVLIVAIGIGCSYRVVILKRIIETSTFRALGLKSKGVVKLFFAEVFLILVFGFIIGIIFSFILSGIIGCINFSFIPAFDLFLIGGKIVPDYSFIKTVCILAGISAATLVSVFLTLNKIIHLSPAKAFSATV